MKCPTQLKSTNLPNRRQMLAMGVAAVAAWNPTTHLLAADEKKSVFQATELNHISLDVLHPGRSAEFYQGLFGMTPVPHGRSKDNFLHFDRGFLNLRPTDQAGMNHFCVSIRDFDSKDVLSVMKSMELDAFAMRRGRLVHVRDPDGLNVQVQEEKHGWGKTVDQLTNADQGVFRAAELHHVSIFVSDLKRSRDFYVEMFGTEVTSQSEDRCVLAIPGGSFIELSTGSKPGMKHYCYAIENFKQGEAIEKLNAFSGAKVEREFDHAIQTKDPQGIAVQITSVGHTLV